jgi:carbon storage regulator
MALHRSLTEMEDSMLVLTRKINEVITIGDDIRILVAEIRGDRVRIAIEAPRNVAVHREEIHKAIKAGNNPTTKTVASSNSVINTRSVVASKVVDRKEVVSMT